jgi:hypothetical protein
VAAIAEDGGAAIPGRRVWVGGRETAGTQDASHANPIGVCELLFDI